MTIRRWLAALVTLIAMASVAGMAQAAELPLSAPSKPSLAVVKKCAQAQLQVAGTAGAPLTVSGLPSACRGLPLHIWLRTASATHRVSTVVPHNGGAVTVTPTVTPTPGSSALATIDTWPMPTTTSITAPPPLPFVSCRRIEASTVGCTARVVEHLNQDWPDYWQRTVEVATSSSTPVRCELVFNLSAGSVPQPVKTLTHTGAVTKVTSARCDVVPRTVTVRGNADHHNETVVSGQRRTAELQGTRDYKPLADNLLLACP